MTERAPIGSAMLVDTKSFAVGRVHRKYSVAPPYETSRGPTSFLTATEGFIRSGFEILIFAAEHYAISEGQWLVGGDTDQEAFEKIGYRIVRETKIVGGTAEEIIDKMVDKEKQKARASRFDAVMEEIAIVDGKVKIEPAPEKQTGKGKIRAATKLKLETRSEAALAERFFEAIEGEITSDGKHKIRRELCKILMTQCSILAQIVAGELSDKAYRDMCLTGADLAEKIVAEILASGNYPSENDEDEDDIQDASDGPYCVVCGAPGTWCALHGPNSIFKPGPGWTEGANPGRYGKKKSPIRTCPFNGCSRELGHNGFCNYKGVK